MFWTLIFIPKEKSIPPLPDMSLLFFREEERGFFFPYRAVCIDLEIDACGNSEEEAWNNLRNSLLLYIRMEKNAFGGSIAEAAKNIKQIAFSNSEQKEIYMSIYNQAKLEYKRSLDNGKILDQIQEEQKFQEIPDVYDLKVAAA